MAHRLPDLPFLFEKSWAPGSPAARGPKLGAAPRASKEAAVLVVSRVRSAALECAALQQKRHVVKEQSAPAGIPVDLQTALLGALAASQHPAP